MLKQTFLPECLYSVDREMTHKKIEVFYENNSSIIGKIIRLDSEKEVFEVDLGGQITGIMPFVDATIYPTHKNFYELSPNIYELVGKNVQVKISGLKNNSIYLSRKDNMLEALENIKNSTYIPFAFITGFSKMSAFMDIGAGINGRAYGKNFATNIFRDIMDIGINKGDFVSVKITEFLENENLFELSRIDALPSVENFLNEDDVITCKVFDPVGDEGKIGYFVGIHNNDYCGIVDSPRVELHYGEEIVAIVNKITDKGVRLDFVEKVTV